MPFIVVLFFLIGQYCAMLVFGDELQPERRQAQPQYRR